MASYGEVRIPVFARYSKAVKPILSGLGVLALGAFVVWKQNPSRADVRQAELLTAASYGHLPLVRSLLDEGADFDPLAPPSNNPLVLAASRGSWEVVSELLRPGQRVAKDANGNSLLHQAAAQGNPTWVDKLAHYGFAIDDTNNTGSTSLHLAAFGDKTEVIELLIRKNADALRTNGMGETALHAAAWQGHRKSALALVAANRSLCPMRDRNGNTASDIARQRGYGELASELAHCDSGTR